MFHRISVSAALGAACAATMTLALCTTPAFAASSRGCIGRAITKAEFQQIHKGMSRQRLEQRFTNGAHGGNLDGGIGMGYVAILYAGGCHGTLNVLIDYDRKDGRWVASLKEWNLTDY